MPNALVNFDTFPDRRTICIKRADAEGIIRIRIQGEFIVSIHQQDNQSRLTGEVRLERNKNNKTEYAVYQWTTSIAAKGTIRNRVRYEMAKSSPRTITLYTAPNHSLPMNPVLRLLDKQFIKSPLEAIRASEGHGNFIALQHLETIKAEYDKEHFSYSRIFFDLRSFLLHFKDPIVGLKNQDLAHIWPAQDTEGLHTLYLFLGQMEPDNQTHSQKLESLEKIIASKRAELDQLERSMRQRYLKALRQ